MKNIIIRIHNESDAKMLEKCRTLHSLFLDNMADFTALDTQLDAAFATEWLAKVTLGDTQVRDSQVKDIQAQLTNIVLAKMELCRIKYKEVKYFADKAFPLRARKQSEFGTNLYSAVRSNQESMISLMDEMHDSCTKYSLEILAVGMTQAQIDEIATLRDELMVANTEQENYMKARLVFSQERIKVLNECYTTTMKVVEAAMIIYYNDYARRRMFVYQKSSGSTGGNTDSGSTFDTISMNIVANDNPVLVYSIAYSSSRQYVLQNNGPAEVEFYIATDLMDMGTPLMLSPGTSEAVTADMLGGIGDLLIVRAMMGGAPDADIEVQVEV